MPDRTGIFLGWSENLSNFLGLGVEAGASPMYPQKMRVPPLGVFMSPQAKGRVSGAFRKTFITYNVCRSDLRQHEYVQLCHTRLLHYLENLPKENN